MSLIKVLWSNRGVEEASWEKEEDMWKEYPNFFEEWLEGISYSRIYCLHLISGRKFLHFVRMWDLRPG